MVQSGLSRQWWREAAVCWAFLHNRTQRYDNGKTPYESRFLTTFHDPLIPFGAMVQYYPANPVDQAALGQFGGKLKAGILIGYVLENGEVWKWRLKIIDQLGLENVRV